MRMVIQSHQGHAMLVIENLVSIPAVGDTLRFPFKDMIATGVVERRQFDFTSNTVTLTGHWLKEAK